MCLWEAHVSSNLDVKPAGELQTTCIAEQQSHERTASSKAFEHRVVAYCIKYILRNSSKRSLPSSSLWRGFVSGRSFHPDLRRAAHTAPSNSRPLISDHAYTHIVYLRE